MSGKAFFDTNILIYAIAQNDSRSAQGESLLATGGVVSVQVLNEFASVTRRKLHMPWSEVVEALDAVRVFCPSPEPITVETHETALAIARKHRFEIYDALIAAAALQAGCETLYSEDFQHGQALGSRLTVVNPFL
jgi:predicted nucleic acid-binding protein